MNGISTDNDHLKSNPTLPIYLGSDNKGKKIIADIVRLPHLIIAGSSGTGKSAFLNQTINSLISNH